MGLFDCGKKQFVAATSVVDSLIENTVTTAVISEQSRIVLVVFFSVATFIILVSTRENEYLMTQNGIIGHQVPDLLTAR